MQREAFFWAGIKLFLFFLLFSVFSTQASAANLLWKASDKDSTVYLFGSFHLGDESFYPLADVVNKAFSQSEALVLEVDQSKMTQEDLQQFIVAGTLDSGKTIESVISKAGVDKLKLVCQQLGLPYASVKTLRPWMIAIQFATIMYQKEGYTPEFGLEIYFSKQAQKRNIPIYQLESLAQQIALFKYLSPDENQFLLESSLDDMQGGKKMANDLVSAWKQGDVDMLDEIMNEAFNHPDAENIRKILLYDRNVGMADKIATYLKENKRYFVAAGAAHFVGKDSILELLEKQGYKIERL